MKKPRFIEIALSVIVFIVIIGIDVFYPNWKLKESHRYTIGIIWKETENRSGKFLIYKFRLSNKEFKGQEPYNLNQEEVDKIMNKRFIVMYNPDKPYVNRIFLNKFIKDTMISPPLDGWIEIPKIEN